MTRIFILFFFCFSITSFAEQVIVSGKIQNPQSTNIEFEVLMNELSGEKATHRAEITPSGAFRVTFDVPFHQFMTIRNGGLETKYFISEYESVLNLSFDANDKSTLGANYNCWNEFNYQFPVFEGARRTFEVGGLQVLLPEQIVQDAHTYDERTFFARLDEYKSAHKHFVDNYAGISASFGMYLNNEIDWMYEISKLSYFIANKESINRHQLADKWTQYSLLRSINLNRSTYVGFPNFQNLLLAFIHYLHIENPVGEDAGLSFYRFADRNFNEKNKYFLQAKIMLDVHKNTSAPELAQRKMKEYRRSNAPKRYITYLESYFGKDTELIGRPIVPQLSFINKDGNVDFLSNYHNKVVLISLWASWCKPCIKGFQMSKESRQRLEAHGIVLLNINIDKTPEIWKNALEKHRPQGTNVFHNDLRNFKVLTGFSNLPFYVLKDKLGYQQYLAYDLLIQNEADIISLTKN